MGKSAFAKSWWNGNRGKKRWVQGSSNLWETMKFKPTKNISAVLNCPELPGIPGNWRHNWHTESPCITWPKKNFIGLSSIYCFKNYSVLHTIYYNMHILIRFVTGDTDDTIDVSPLLDTPQVDSGGDLSCAGAAGACWTQRCSACHGCSGDAQAKSHGADWRCRCTFRTQGLHGYFIVKNTAGWWGHPSEKYESQLGWWHSQYTGKINSGNQTTNQSWLKNVKNTGFNHNRP